MKDGAIVKLIREETKRQAETLDLIPSENTVSQDVLKALGSVLTNKYSEGYPGKRYYAGNEYIDKIENLCRTRALKLFHCSPKQWGVNVQAYSGSPANMAVYYALLQPGEKIMGMSLPFGGHLTHGWKANFSARFYKSIQYTVGRDGYIDYTALRKMAKKERPQIVVTGATAYPRVIDFKKVAAIAHEIGAYFLADISHEAGLIAAGVYPSPFPYADVITMTTHKTLRGPRGAIIFTNIKSKIAKRKKCDIAKEIDRAVFPGLQGGPHDHQTAAIAVALHEAAQPSFKKYGRQVAKNAASLAKELARYGFNLVSGGTDNHLMLIDLTKQKISGRNAQDRLEKSGIIVNRNAVPYDQRKPFDPSGIRLGTPALTSRGMKEKEMKEIAKLIHTVLIKNKNVKNEVAKLCRKYKNDR
ncbi:MAG: serine hydroxymethyltransferase [Candidatus Kaiserbacteria bacterium]|nr:serine hydroxymethyltransferase [Candidatus Kaiserbacteria bacterium]